MQIQAITARVPLISRIRSAIAIPAEIRDRWIARGAGVASAIVGGGIAVYGAVGDGLDTGERAGAISGGAGIASWTFAIAWHLRIERSQQIERSLSRQIPVNQPKLGIPEQKTA